MSELIVKPFKEKVDLQICIPAYRREKELKTLHDSIRKSLVSINYNIYFLLNGASDNVKKLVLDELSLFENTGVILFNENIKEDIFIWPLLNLPKGHFWIIGDDDSITDKANEVVERSLKNDLTILNYDLYDQALEKKLFGSFLEKYFKKQSNYIDKKYLFSNLSEKLSFISSIIIRSNIISKDFISIEPKSFQFGGMIYTSLADHDKDLKISFEETICLNQRGNNISNDDKYVTDDIFINDLRFFYLSMLKIPVYRYSAIVKLIKATFLLTPRLLLRSSIEHRYPRTESFFIIDYIYFFVVKFFIRLIPKAFFIFLKSVFR